MFTKILRNFMDYFRLTTRYQRSFLNEGNKHERVREEDEKQNKMGLFRVH